MSPTNPLDQMQSYYDDFTKTDKDIAVYILNNSQTAATISTEDLAKIIHVSKSALSRFAKRIGYSGFIEFRYTLSRFLVSENAAGGTEGEDGNALQSIIASYENYLTQMSETCDVHSIQKIAKAVVKADRIKIVGSNRTYNSALQMKQRLGRMGFDSEAVCDLITLADACAIVGKRDLVILFTIHDSVRYDKYVKQCKERGCTVVCVTMTQDLPYRKLCDTYVVLPRISRDSKVSFLDDQPLFMIYIEILLAEIAKL